MRDNRLVQWVVSGLSVVAFIILLKFGAAHLPETGLLGAIRRVVGSL